MVAKAMWAFSWRFGQFVVARKVRALSLSQAGFPIIFRGKPYLSSQGAYMKRMNSLALACVLSTLSGTVFAASSASASVTGIKFQLIDLAPDDGVAPSFTLGDDNVTMAYGWVDDVGRTSTPLPQVMQSTPGWLANQSGRLTSTSSTAVVDWSAGAEGLGLSASAQGLGGQYNLSLVTGDGSDSDYLVRNLRLSANSLLNVELSYSLDALASNAPACVKDDVCARWSSFSTERANASVGLSLSYNYLEDGLNVGYSKLVRDSVQAMASPGIEAGAYIFDEGTGDLQLVSEEVPGHDQASHAEGILKVSFFNASQSDQLAKLRIGMSVWGAGNTLAVPEPSQFYLFALGSGALYARLRRNRTA